MAIRSGDARYREIVKSMEDAHRASCTDNDACRQIVVECPVTHRSTCSCGAVLMPKKEDAR